MPPKRLSPNPYIDVNDITDVDVAVLTEEGHSGEIYEVTRPRTLTFIELVREVYQDSGREVQFVQTPKERLAELIAES